MEFLGFSRARSVPWCNNVGATEMSRLFVEERRGEKNMFIMEKVHALLKANIYTQKHFVKLTLKQLTSLFYL